MYFIVNQIHIRSKNVAFHWMNKLKLDELWLDLKLFQIMRYLTVKYYHVNMLQFGMKMEKYVKVWTNEGTFPTDTSVWALLNVSVEAE